LLGGVRDAGFAGSRPNDGADLVGAPRLAAGIPSLVDANLADASLVDPSLADTSLVDASLVDASDDRSVPSTIAA
jgi:hypothetical protein